MGNTDPMSIQCLAKHIGGAQSILQDLIAHGTHGIDALLHRHKQAVL